MKELKWKVLTIAILGIFLACYKSQSRSYKVKCLFMHDNATSHVFKPTLELFRHKKFTGAKIMEWPPSSPVWIWLKIWSRFWKWNYMKIVYSVTAKHTYKKSIKTTMLEIESAELKNISKSMDNREQVVIE